MPFFAIPFPAIDPVAVAVGPFVVRWYALAYIVGLLIGWRYCLMLADRPPRLVERRDIDDFLVWATLGVVLGGRIGYAVARMSGELFRQPDAQLGFLVFGTTMGQLLSIPVLIAGIVLILWAFRRSALAAAAHGRAAAR